ncbi:hypothetical protein AB0E67_35775 [Streptomyces sp. NPDC032161]|uniref:hypothetical protein n=1 Tax=unclassified Streptomyces TaxID=2593676 RepID=UPI0034075D53
MTCSTSARSTDLALLSNLREVIFVEDGVLAVPDAAEVFAAPAERRAYLVELLADAHRLSK